AQPGAGGPQPAGGGGGGGGGGWGPGGGAGAAAAGPANGTRRYHDRVAKKYDDLYDTPYWRFYRDLSWRHLKPFVPERRPAWAADLGCGTGWFGTRLLKAGCSGVFLDPGGKMVEQSRGAGGKGGPRGRGHAAAREGDGGDGRGGERASRFRDRAGRSAQLLREPGARARGAGARRETGRRRRLVRGQPNRGRAITPGRALARRGSRAPRER